MKHLITLLLAIVSALAFAPSRADDAEETFGTQCASEGGTCTFTGTKQVLFGTDDRWVMGTFTGSVQCSASSFGGDPARNRVKACKIAGTSTVPTGSGQAPTYASIQGKPVFVGQKNAVAGEIIRGQRFTNPNGPCIVIQVANVRVEDNEIGPCGDQSNAVQNTGISMLGAGAFNITIQRNVIHDASSCLYASSARHPIVIDRNLCFNIMNYAATNPWQGNFVQFAGVNTFGANGQSKITCNVIDGRSGIAYAPRVNRDAQNYREADHISMYRTRASVTYPLEIAYNRIRGRNPSTAPGGYYGGSGMQLGDGVNGGANPQSGNFRVHDNTVVQTNGTAISIAGGEDIQVYNNKMDQRGEQKLTWTAWSAGIRMFDTANRCFGHTFNNNRATIATLWADLGFNPSLTVPPQSAGVAAGTPNIDFIGATADGNYVRGGCTFQMSGNNWNDAALTANTPQQNWDASVYSECN